MKRFEILDANGEVENTILADDDFVNEHYAGRFRAALDLPAAPVVRSYDDQKADKLAEANRQCDQRINALTATYPQTEVLTFSKQETEARAFLANANAATPLIDALASTRQINKTELANRIIAKSDVFATYTGLIVGRRQAIEDALAIADSQDEIDAIDPLDGWPA